MSPAYLAYGLRGASLRRKPTASHAEPLDPPPPFSVQTTAGPPRPRHRGFQPSTMDASRPQLDSVDPVTTAGTSTTETPSVQIITDEMHQPSSSSPVTPGPKTPNSGRCWDNSVQDIDRPFKRAHWGLVPYVFPGAKKERRNEAALSFERQKQILALADKTKRNDKSSVAASEARVPPHLRIPKPSSPVKSRILETTSAGVHFNPKDDSEIAKSTIAAMKAYTDPPHLQSFRASISPKPTNHQVPEAPKTTEVHRTEQKSSLPPHLQLPSSQLTTTKMKPHAQPITGIQEIETNRIKAPYQQKVKNGFPVGAFKAALTNNSNTSHIDIGKMPASAYKGKQPEDTTIRSPLMGWDRKMIPPPVGSDWTYRDRSSDPKEKHAILQAWRNEQAADPNRKLLMIDVNSAEFQSGQGNAGGDKGLGSPIKEEDHITIPYDDGLTRANAQRTTEDLIKENAERLSKIAEVDEIRSMSNKQKRELRRAIVEFEENYVPPPNPYAPDANVYLRSAEAKDVRQITEIWNHYAETSTAVPSKRPDDEAFWREELLDTIDSGNPFIVAVLMRDNASRNPQKVRRLKRELIVGFARTANFGTNNNAFCYTVELEMLVKDGYRRRGIGNVMLDRILAALCPGHSFKEGAPFIYEDNIAYWIGGGKHYVKTILLSILHHKDDPELQWKKDWMIRNHFAQIGIVPKVGYKLGKELNLCQMNYETMQTVSPLMMR